MISFLAVCVSASAFVYPPKLVKEMTGSYDITLLSVCLFVCLYIPCKGEGNIVPLLD
jgi:hypothetical protein